MRAHYIFIPLVLAAHFSQAQQPKPSPVNTQFVSPILPVVLKGNVIPPSPAEAKDYLFWIKGKKINDSTIVTTDARVGQYSSKRNMVVVQPAQKNDPSNAIVKELANTQKRKEELYNKISGKKSSVMLVPLMNRSFKELDNIQQDFSDALKNTVNLPPPVNASAHRTPARGGYASVNVYTLAVPEHVRRACNEILSLKKNYPSIEFSAPPAQEFNQCETCDTAKASGIATAADEWMKEFTEYEGNLISRTLQVFGSFEKLNLNQDAEAVQMRAELDKVIDFAFARLTNKVDLLIRNYGKDFTRLRMVIQAALSVERQKQLYGTSGDSYAKTMVRLMELMDGFDAFLKKQMEEKNYDIGLNLPLMISVERQRQLLGNTEKPLETYVDLFTAFNRFRLDFDIDYYSEEENDCGISTDKVDVKLEAQHYVTLLAANCKYSFLTHEEHLKDGQIHQFGMGMPIEMKMGSGKRVVREKNDNDECVSQTFTYSGLRVMAEMPDVHISFCGADDDSIVFNEFHAGKKPETQSLFYSNIGNLFHFVSNYEPDESLIDEQEAIQIQMEQFTLKESKLNKKLTLEEMQRLHKLIARREEIAVQIDRNDEEMAKFTDVFDAKNGDEVVMDVKKDLVYDGGDYGKKATFKVRIRVVHDPAPLK